MGPPHRDVENAPDGTQAGLLIDREHRRDITAGRSLTDDLPTRGSVRWEFGASTCGPDTRVTGRSFLYDTRTRGVRSPARHAPPGEGPPRPRLGWVAPPIRK
ncbi:hypothetical protein GCM10010246_33330 [Streptomyces cuspidosporus]|uniref:Uncharacterized protein n=1 Tax=Streptomyces cuspidosporus TaxID=66882 RepID=A0ABP5T3T6_9ACTN